MFETKTGRSFEIEEGALRTETSPTLVVRKIAQYHDRTRIFSAEF